MWVFIKIGRRGRADFLTWHHCPPSPLRFFSLSPSYYVILSPPFQFSHGLPRLPPPPPGLAKAFNFPSSIPTRFPPPQSPPSSISASCCRFVDADDGGAGGAPGEKP
ncbi:hypothetical protein NL676_021974 [Syzygium grande]|nr:hypothetical protein NL676_021974 [Syzygium grande]